VADEETKVYALNLFDIADREEYLAYSRRSAREVARHGGRVLALGRFRESAAGDIAPRQVLIVVEWESRAAFESYRQDPALADLHRTGNEAPRRTCGTCSTGSTTCGCSFSRERNRRNTRSCRDGGPVEPLDERCSGTMCCQP
jgi:uncharacterized protein (DUF1330 family)